MFSEQLIRNATELAASGRVGQIEMEKQSKHKFVVFSRVLEKQKNPFRTNIEFSINEKGGCDSFSSVCNCYAYSRCKHALAILIAISLRGELEKLPQSIQNWLKASHLLKDNVSAALADISYEVILPKSSKDKLSIVIYETINSGKSKQQVSRESLLERENKTTYLGVIDEQIINALAEPISFKEADETTLAYIISKDDAFISLLQTKKAFIKGQKKPLSLAKDKNLVIDWQLNNDGSQELLLKSSEKGDLVFLIGEVYFINAKENCAGLLKANLSSDIIKALFYSLPIPAERIKKTREKLAPLIGQDFLPKDIPISKKAKKLALTLSLDFATYEVFEAYKSQCAYQLNGQVIGVVATYLYGSHKVIKKGSEPASSFLVAEKGKLVEVIRDNDKEALLWQKANQLLKLIPSIGQDGLSIKGSQKNSTFLVTAADCLVDKETFIEQCLPKLIENGIDLSTKNLHFFEVLQAIDGKWISEISTSGDDFFNFELGIIFEGQKIQILPLVVDLLKKYELEELNSLADDFCLTLAINKYKKIAIPLGRIKPVLNVLGEVIQKQMAKGEVKLSLAKRQASLLYEMSQASKALEMRWLDESAMLRLGEELSDFKKIEDVAPPKNFLANLRDYQRSGINWLQFLRRYHFSGILADEMGLGKTVQTLAHLTLEKEAGRLNKPCLIVAPTSLMSNWEQECQKFSPSLSFLVHHGDKRDKQVVLKDYDLIFTTYALVIRDKDFFLNEAFYYLILDEAQNIKNSSTKTTQVLLQFQAANRLCLTGTPLENHLGELWSLFNFLMPGFLLDKNNFNKTYRTPIEKENDVEAGDGLKKRIKPFLLRRIKKEVALELPLKTETTVWVDLKGKQRDIYESIRLSMQDKVRNALLSQGLNKSHIIILDALLRLRQTCCSPELLKLEDKKDVPSEKVDVLFEMLPTLIEEGRKILLFSQFTSMIAILEKELEKREIGYVTLTGKTKDRKSVIKTFSETDVPVFLISLKAGGTGLNLTKADTVIHFDPWWNPQVENQATDRTHRIGQTKPVFVYRLVCKDTVEDVMQTLKQRKSDLVDNLLSLNQGTKLNLTEDDIKALFDTPLPT